MTPAARRWSPVALLAAALLIVLAGVQVYALDRANDLVERARQTLRSFPTLVAGQHDCGCRPACRCCECES